MQGSFWGFIIAFIKDRTIKMRSKVLFILFVMVVLLSLNDVLGFTFYYAKAKKVEEVARITEVLNDTIPPELKRQIQRLRSDILERQSLLGKLFDKGYFLNNKEMTQQKAISDIPAQDTIIAAPNPHNTESTIDPTLKGGVNRQIITDSNNHKDINDANKTLLILSSSGIYFLLFILFCLAFITGTAVNCEYDNKTGKYVESADKTANSFAYKLGVSVVALVITVLLAILSYILFGLLFSKPLLGKWWLTYTVIFVLSLAPPSLILFPSFLDAWGLKHYKNEIKP